MLCERHWESVLHRLVWLFALGSMAGFLLESMDSVLRLGYLENRQGMLYGPFSPIYGIGALLFACSAPWLKHRSVPTQFAVAALLGAAAEYGCAWVQERAFGARFWDYSGTGLEFQGRINLVLTLCWGALGVAFLLLVWPAFVRFLDGQRAKSLRLVTLFLLVLFLLDGGMSAAALVRQNHRNRDIPATTAFAAFLDEQYDDGRLSETFPTMTTVQPD